MMSSSGHHSAQSAAAHIRAPWQACGASEAAARLGGAAGHDAKPQAAHAQAGVERQRGRQGEAHAPVRAEVDEGARRLAPRARHHACRAAPQPSALLASFRFFKV